MALSGEFRKQNILPSPRSDFGLICRWSASDVSTGSNNVKYRTVTVRPYLCYFTIYKPGVTDDIKLYIDDSLRSTKSSITIDNMDRPSDGNWREGDLLASSNYFTFNINYNSDGTASPVTVKVRYDYSKDGATYGNKPIDPINASGDIVLDSIPVYSLTLSQGEHTSLSVKRAGTTLSNGASLTNGDRLTISASQSSGYKSPTITVNGNSFVSGNSYTVSGNVTISTVTEPIQSGSRLVATNATVEKHNGVLSGNVIDFAIEKINQSYTHTIEQSKNGTDWTEIPGLTKTDDPYPSWNISADILKDTIFPINQTTHSGSNSVTWYFRCTTYDGSTQVGTKTTTTANIKLGDSFKPEMNVSVTDINTKTVALTGDSSIIVKGASTVRCSIDTHSAIKISSSDTNAIVAASMNGSSVPISSWYIDIVNASASTYGFTIKDRRGLSTYERVTPTAVIEYYKPTATFSVERVSVTEATTEVEKIRVSYNVNGYNGTFGESGSQSNSFGIAYTYRAGTGMDSSRKYKTISIGSGSFYIETDDPIDQGETYTVNVGVYDSIQDKDNVALTSYKLAAPVPVFDWGKDDFRFNVNTIFNHGFSFQKCTQEINSDHDLNNFYIPGVYGIGSNDSIPTNSPNISGGIGAGVVVVYDSLGAGSADGNKDHYWSAMQVYIPASPTKPMCWRRFTCDYDDVDKAYTIGKTSWCRYNANIITI